MTLTEILKVLRQWWWILVLCPLAAAGTAYFFASSMPPVYEAKATTLVEHQLASGTLDLQSIQAAERRTRTFTQVVTSRSVLERVVDNHDIDTTVGELRAASSASNAPDTQLVTITAQAEDPERAAIIANAIAEEFAAYVQEIQDPLLDTTENDLSVVVRQVGSQIQATQERIDTLEAAGDGLSVDGQNELTQLREFLAQLEQTEALFLGTDGAIANAGQNQGSQVYLIEPASPPGGPVSPRVMFITTVAGIVGAVFAAGCLGLLSYREDKITRPEDITSLADHALVTSIPRQTLPEHVESLHSGRSVVGDYFQGLRVNLDFVRDGNSVQSVLVTSSRNGEGKTTIAANLAVALAEAGQRVILVDADLRRPSVHTRFKRVFNHKGLSNLLLADVDLESTLQSTDITNLQVLTSGTLPLNPSVLLSSEKMRALVRELEEISDCIVFDSPPIPISDTLTMSALAGGVLYVVRTGLINSREFLDGLDTLSRSGTPLLGVVLNAVAPASLLSHHVHQEYYGMGMYDVESNLEESQRPGWMNWVFPWRT